MSVNLLAVVAHIICYYIIVCGQQCDLVDAFFAIMAATQFGLSLLHTSDAGTHPHTLFLILLDQCGQQILCKISW